MQSLQIRSGVSSAPQSYFYRLAHIVVESDFRIEQWAAYAMVPPTQDVGTTTSKMPLISAGFAKTTNAWINGKWRDVSRNDTADYATLRAANLASCQIASAKSSIKIEVDLPPQHSTALEDSLLGVALMLVLPAFARWPVHGGTLETIGGQGVGFVGVSGVGKSTLTTTLASRLTEVALVGDDVAIISNAEGVLLWPQFPQLKLAAEVGRSERVKIPLRALYMLVPVEQTESVSITSVSKQAALMHLVRHTIAAKLYPPALLQVHLANMQAINEVVAFYQLNVPRDLARLTEVGEMLKRHWQAKAWI